MAGIGYKFTKDVNTGELYIVTIKYFNEQPDNDPPLPLSYFTSDCIVIDITNPNTNEKVNVVKGIAYEFFIYEVGKRYTGVNIYFCKSRLAVYISFLVEVNGKLDCMADYPFEFISGKIHHPFQDIHDSLWVFSFLHSREETEALCTKEDSKIFSQMEGVSE